MLAAKATAKGRSDYASLRAPHIWGPHPKARRRLLHKSIQAGDLVVLPGGLGGAERLEADRRIAALLRRMTEQGRYVAAICAAPRVLAKAGLLNDREATAYPGILDGRAEIRLSSAAVVRDGNFITSRGPGTALDFALTLIEILCGRTQRDTVEAALQRS